MKICLVNPPQILHKRFGMPYVFQPLGLLYVAAALEKDCSVEVIDASLEGWRNLRETDSRYCLGLTFDETGRRIGMIKPDVVGISAPFSINIDSAIKVASAVKGVNKNIITILGGTHPSVHPLETLSSEHVDFVVIGEGEETAPELIRVLKEHSYEKLKDVKGIGYKEKDTPVLTPPRTWIQDIDSLPFPARHLVLMEEYFNAMKAGRGARGMYTYNERWTDIITSRGCPYNCNFCSIHLTMGRKFRTRSPENVIREIKQVIHDFNIKHINFEDDNITMNRNHAELIFDLISENKLGITWSLPNGIRCDNVGEEIVIKMKESGCKRLFVAPESGVQRVVNQIIGKNLDLKKVENAVILFKRHGIVVDGSFVMGLIGETKSDIWKTIKYALRLKRLGMDTAGFHIATPYYGTSLYEEAKQKGFLRKDLDDSLFTTSESLISTSEWSREEIVRLSKIAKWIVNYDVKDKIVYVAINYFPILWKFLKYTKKSFIYVLSIPARVYQKVYFWSSLFKNAFVNMAMKVMGRLPKVEWLVFEATDACNSRCIHCYIWKCKTTKSNLTAKEVEKILSDNFFGNLKSVLITGGEPTLRDDIKELIASIHRARPNAKIALSTNALLPERVLDVLKFTIANNIPLGIGISLDAIGEKHDRIRGVKGNFEKANYLIQELIKLKEKHNDKIEGIVIGHTLSNLTADTLGEVLTYAKQMKVEFLTQLYEEFTFYNNVSKGKEYNIEFYQHSDNRTLIDSIKKLPLSFHNEILLCTLRHRLRYRCAAMRTFFLLRCDGSISPCLRYSDVSAGNIKFQPPYEIWHGNEVKKIRRLVEKCQGCSNSWATDWSFRAWFPPFLKISISLAVKNVFRKLEKRNGKDICQKYYI